MRLNSFTACLFTACLIYLLFKFVHPAAEKIPCYYDNQHEDFFFTVKIVGIEQNITCKNNCGCYGIPIGYSTVMPCESCCSQERSRTEKCQKSVMYTEINHGRLKCFFFH